LRPVFARLPLIPRAILPVLLIARLDDGHVADLRRGLSLLLSPTAGGFSTPPQSDSFWLGLFLQKGPGVGCIVLGDVDGR
jgi:hypothetical protein